MKLIRLTNSRLRAMVSDRDYAKISKLKWRLHRDGHVNYAVYGERGVGMHKLILPSCREIDHRDRDGLNNTRRNLRPCTRSYNNANAKKRSGTTSRYKGVFWHKGDRRWRAHATIHGHIQYLGSYRSERGAAQAYNAAARKLFGKFARLNKI